MTEIDIILPFFNGSKFIEEQIKSITNNDLDGILVRLIIINDASSEDETTFLKSLLPQNHLYLKNEANLGVIKSVERGLEASTAPYVMLCDQDDVWLPGKIKQSLKKLVEIEGHEPALVYTDLIISGPNLEVIHPSMHRYYEHNHSRVYPSILFHNIVTGCTIIMNRRLIEIACPFPDNITMHDHWLAVCAVFAGKFQLLNEATVLYRQHGTNQVGAPSEKVLPKLLNMKEVVPRFQRHIRMKSLMARSLADRLSFHGKNKRLLSQIVQAIKNKDVILLIRSGAISGKIIRILAVSTILLLGKRNR